MPTQRVLIVGAGTAGSIAAFWLAKSDFQVTVIERGRLGQKLGQGIEIEEPALAVVKEMGIFEKLQAVRTSERGFQLVDERGRNFGILSSADAVSPTGGLELMRGDLTETLYKAADESPNVTYRYETTIKGLRQDGEKVSVDLESRSDGVTKTEEFDFVLGADGQKSRTREIVFGTPEELDCFKPVGSFNAYFSIPKLPQDGPKSRLCNFPGRRIIWTRPISEASDEVTVYFILGSKDIPGLREANTAGDRPAQKKILAKHFEGAGWESKRIIEGMMDAKNFYSEELLQVKLKTWSKDRVALVGDSAWAPTPFTGEGNQLAILGAWTIAQELSRHRSTKAFEAYEKRMRSYVEKAQVILTPLPKLLNPSTATGIWILRRLFYLASLGIHAYTRLTREKPDDGTPSQNHEPFDLQIETKEKVKAIS